MHKAETHSQLGYTIYVDNTCWFPARSALIWHREHSERITLKSNIGAQQCHWNGVAVLFEKLLDPTQDKRMFK